MCVCMCVYALLGGDCRSLAITLFNSLSFDVLRGRSLSEIDAAKNRTNHLHQPQWTNERLSEQVRSLSCPWKTADTCKECHNLTHKSKPKSLRVQPQARLGVHQGASRKTPDPLRRFLGTPGMRRVRPKSLPDRPKKTKIGALSCHKCRTTVWPLSQILSFLF